MSQSQSKDKTIIIAAIITGVFGCIAAIIGLGSPVVKNLADRYIPPSTPISTNTLLSETQANPTETTSLLPQIKATPLNNDFPVIQVGPYWSWSDKFSSMTLMLNVLWVGDCASSIEIVADDETFSASMITDANSPFYLHQETPFEGTTGTSCNYLVSSSKVLKPSRYFSVPSATYGVNLPNKPPYEWCYQASDKTWYPCK